MCDLVSDQYSAIIFFPDIVQDRCFPGADAACDSDKKHISYFASYQLAPLCTSTSNVTFRSAAAFILSTRIFRTCSTSSSAVSISSSSCTCRISLDFNPDCLSASQTRIMAILMMSAAVPWIGEFIATRSPKDRCMKFEEASSGTGRLL